MVVVQFGHGIATICTAFLVALNDIEGDARAVPYTYTREIVTLRTAIDNLTLVHTGYSIW